MTTFHRLVRAAMSLALSTVAAVGHAADKTPDPVDADAIVPATRYQSVLAYRPVAAPPLSPPQNWQALNLQVGGYDPMTLSIDSETVPAKPAASAANPSAPAQPTPAPDPHAHHHRKDVK
jgi:hypothetical protein